MFGPEDIKDCNLPMCLYCRNYQSTNCRKIQKTSYFEQCNFDPENIHNYISIMVQTLKLQNVVSKNKKYKSPVSSVKINGSMDHESQYYYFSQLVCDSIQELRKGRNCYVFTLRQIKEILKYCPNIDVLYLKDSNSFILKNSK